MDETEEPPPGPGESPGAQVIQIRKEYKRPEFKRPNFDLSIEAANSPNEAEPDVPLDP